MLADRGLRQHQGLRGAVETALVGDGDDAPQRGDVEDGGHGPEATQNDRGSRSVVMRIRRWTRRPRASVMVGMARPCSATPGRSVPAGVARRDGGLTRRRVVDHGTVCSAACPVR
ncbi:hypothetical protein GCM10025792_43990 [Pseudonocardia tropica]